MAQYNSTNSTTPQTYGPRVYTPEELEVLQQAATILGTSVSDLLNRPTTVLSPNSHHDAPVAPEPGFVAFHSLVAVPSSNSFDSSLSAHVSDALAMPESWNEEITSYSPFELEPPRGPFLGQNLGDENYQLDFDNAQPVTAELPSEPSYLFTLLPTLLPGSCDKAPRPTSPQAAGWEPNGTLDFSVSFESQASFASIEPPSNGNLQVVTDELRCAPHAAMATDSALKLTPAPVLSHKTSHARAPRSKHHRPSQSTAIITKTPGRRGPFKDLGERAQTALARKLGACLRCRKQKTRCVADPANPHGICKTCSLAAETAIVMPICLRKKVTDAKLFAKGKHPQFIWSKRWKSMEIVDITSWASADVRTIYVTQDVAGLSYPLRVREFIPEEGDSLQRTWKTKGVQQHYQCANYAIEDMKQTGRNMVKFVDSSIDGFVNSYIDRSDRLLYQTYSMALKYTKDIEVDAHERELIRATLRLWVAVRMESRSERICGDETLGQEPQSYDRECNNFGQVLVSPVMSAQIELIATATLLNPAKKAVLGSLRKLMEASKTQSWLTIYLCLFILLHSCALLTEFEHRQAKKYGSRTRYVYDEFVKELHHGSAILLAYFHYGNKGSYPLLMDWEASPDIPLADLSPEQVQFMKESSKLVKEKGHHFERIRKDHVFEDAYFFLSQLYDREWKPVRTI